MLELGGVVFGRVIRGLVRLFGLLRIIGFEILGIELIPAMEVIGAI